MFKTNIQSRHLAFGIIALFLAASFFLIDDFGINIDSPKNFREGKLNLHFLLTGKILDENVALHQTHGAFMFMAGEAFGLILHDHLDWIQDPVTARHAVLPVLMAWFFWLFFSFVKKYWSDHIALLALLLFMTFPGFVGHTFNNLKDISLLVFFSLTCMAFFDWSQTKNLRSFYFFFIFLGLALSTKLIAFTTLLISAVWYCCSFKIRPPLPFRHWGKHAFLGSVITALLVAIFYFPAFWGMPNKLEFLKSWFAEIQGLTLLQTTSWGWRPFMFILWQTPVLMLIAAGADIIKNTLDFFKSKNRLFLLIWLLLPLFLGCLPHVNYYSGLRHILFFLPPFIILATLGIDLVARCAFPFLRDKKVASYWLMGLIILAFNMNALRIMHPYESLFNNWLAGGLKGAQQNKTYCVSWDMWLTSYKEAGAWLDTHAEPNAHVIINYYTLSKKPWQKPLLAYLMKRKDLQISRRNPDAWADTIPPKTYVVFVPFIHYYEYDDYKNLLENDPDLKAVYKSTRQGGEIFTIYYKS